MSSSLILFPFDTLAEFSVAPFSSGLPLFFSEGEERDLFFLPGRRSGEGKQLAERSTCIQARSENTRKLLGSIERETQVLYVICVKLVEPMHVECASWLVTGFGSIHTDALAMQCEI